MNAIVKPENLCLSVDQVAERLGGQTLHHSRKDAPVPPSLPSVVEGLCRTIFSGSIAPAQAIAIYEDNPAQDAQVIDPRLAMALGKERPKPRNLFVCKPEKIAHLAPHILAALNHAGAAVSSGSLGPERRAVLRRGRQDFRVSPPARGVGKN